MNILFLTKYYSEGPSSRYRSYNYKDFFEKEGIKVEYKPLFYNGYVKNLYSNKKNSKIKIIFSFLFRIYFILKNKKKYDHIIIEKEILPYFPYFIEKFLLKDKSYSLDFDDNPKYRYSKNRILKILYGNKIDLLVHSAKFVTVGNKWYFDDFEYNKNFVYIPTVIDIDKYKIKNYFIKNDMVQIVWIGSPSTQNNLFLIKDALEKICEKYPNVKFNFIGSNIRLSNINYENIEWSEEREVELIKTNDIGIMPLKDGYWEKGKCGFKLIQYMGCGLPVIASAVSANKEIVDHGYNGFLVENVNDWFKYLETLILYSKARKEMGIKGRKKIETQYSYQKISKIYLKLLIE